MVCRPNKEWRIYYLNLYTKPEILDELYRILSCNIENINEYERGK